MMHHSPSDPSNMPIARLRPALMILAVLSLLTGLWAGLLRLGWAMPNLPLVSDSAARHGAFMLAGFLGTVIMLERAVVLNRPWAYLGPLCSGLGGAALLLGLPDGLSIGLLLIGSLGLLIIFVRILRTHFKLHYQVMAAGALFYAIGNLLWWLGWPIYQAVPWWVAFLVLTVLGERLELGRVFIQDRLRLAWVLAAAALVVMGLLVGFVRFEIGIALCGLGYIGVGLWLMRNDIARHTIRKTGLPRYMAACLLPGYFWLTVSGLLWVFFAPQFLAGMAYDAMLHTLLVGFVFSMIFGHAPIIIPTVTGIIITSVQRLYLPLALLHAALLLRVMGDLTLQMEMRQWGGLLNEIAILLFAALVVHTAVQARAQSKANPQPQSNLAARLP